MNIEEEIFDALTELQTRIFEEAYECTSCQFEIREFNPVSCALDRACDLMESHDSPLECPAISDTIKELI